MIQRCLTLALVSAFAAPVASQDAVGHAARSQEVQFAAGDHELGDVVSWVSDFLQVELLLDASECMGADMRVRTRHDITVDKDGAWELLNSVLNHRGMAVIPLNLDLKLYEIINLQGAKRNKVYMSPMLVEVENIDRVSRWNATPVLCRVPLVNANATVATNALRPFFAQSGGASMLQIGNMGNNSELILQGMGDQVAAAVRLIRAADASSAPKARSMSVVALKHVNAAALAQQLDQFSRQQQQAGVRPTGPSDMLKVVAAPDQNAVVISGNAAQIKQVHQLIEVLDVPGAKAPAAQGREIDDQIRELREQMKKLQKELDSLRKQSIR